MAILTALRLHEIEQLMAAFGLDVVEAEGVLLGSVNTSFKVVDRQGQRYWLRVYEAQPHRGAAREARLLSQLASRGVITPAPLPRLTSAAHGRFVATIHDKPVCLFPFVEGVHRRQAEVTTEDTQRVGASLARLHEAGEALADGDELTEPSRFTISSIRQRLASLSGRNLPLEIERACTTLEQCALDFSGFRPRARPLRLIHGDLFRDNVLFAADGGVTLLDFESASTGHAAFDLMTTMLAWCFGSELNQSLAKALFRGYANIRSIDSSVVDDLGEEGRIACIRFATTRITDYELRPRGQGIYRDYRRFLARLHALDQLGASLPEFLGL